MRPPVRAVERWTLLLAARTHTDAVASALAEARVCRALRLSPCTCDISITYMVPRGGPNQRKVHRVFRGRLVGSLRPIAIGIARCTRWLPVVHPRKQNSCSFHLSSDRALSPPTHPSRHTPLPGATPQPSSSRYSYPQPAGGMHMLSAVQRWRSARTAGFSGACPPSRGGGVVPVVRHWQQRASLREERESQPAAGLHLPSCYTTLRWKCCCMLATAGSVGAGPCVRHCFAFHEARSAHAARARSDERGRCGAGRWGELARELDAFASKEIAAAWRLALLVAEWNELRHVLLQPVYGVLERWGHLRHRVCRR